MAWLGFKKSPYLQWLEKGVDCGDPHITSHCSEKGLERHTTVFWSQVLFDSVFFFFQEQYETSGAVLSRQIHFSKTEITLGVERMISLFPGWETASVLLQPMSQQYCSWEKKSYWHLTKKDNYKLSLRWCLVSPKQHSSPPGARQLTEYPEKEVKEQEWSRQV